MSMLIESFFFVFYSERLGFGSLKNKGSFQLKKYKNKDKEDIERVKKINQFNLEKKEIEDKVKNLKDNADNDTITKKEIARLNYKLLEVEKKIKKLK
ncbi:MAG: hypothetical protein LRZ97_01125 [Candidatus Pacebacteria bacterium]|nr:hypothetical protein [Candidatus Paceibacterota bacterium]